MNLKQNEKNVYLTYLKGLEAEKLRKVFEGLIFVGDNILSEWNQLIGVGEIRFVCVDEEIYNREVVYLV